MESQLKILSDIEWDELRSEDLCYKLAGVCVRVCVCGEVCTCVCVW